MRMSVLLVGCLLFVRLAAAQSTNATITGRVVDPSNAVVTTAKVDVISLETGTRSSTRTNREGLFTVGNLLPNTYRIEVSKPGFKTVIKPDVILHVQDVVAVNFTLPVGAAAESITVEAGAPMINTTNASVSTVIDQTYVKNMPLNGRSLQDLILLTPGIVTQSSQSVLSNLAGSAGLGLTGEFSVNGQRAESNNYTVDGASANLGATPGVFMISAAGASGSLPGATALGTTQALVSVDDLQEFRVQSSTYSAEYGRNPGGQFAFETKSGTNQWHGSAFDYLRNDAFDANDWFNNYLSVPVAPLRQNDFGGTLGGPVWIPDLYHGKDKTFFFVSYEGLRLLQPQAASINGVPDDCLRGTSTANCPSGIVPADPAIQPVLRAFPVANGTEFGDGFAPFKSSWSNPSSIDSTSVRLDQMVGEKLRLFFRFSDTGSDSSRRGQLFTPPSMKDTTAFTLRTYTGGVNSIITSQLSNEFRLNYSTNETTSNSVIGAFGGSTPVNLAQLTSLGTLSSPSVTLCWDPFYCPTLTQGISAGTQKQWNLVDTLSYLRGRHQLKLGVDYRRLAPFETDVNPAVAYQYFGACSPVPNCDLGTSTQANVVDFAIAFTQAPAYPLYKNFSAFAEDEWRVTTRLNLSMGLRWDVNPPPGVTKGLMPYTVLGASPATWALAPQGTPLWHTAWFNFAPRLGVAYSVRNSSGWETVLRIGGGLFFDTGQQLGSAGFGGPGFIGIGIPADVFGDAPPVPFPALPPAPVIGTAPGSATPYVFPTHFQAPYTLQWNASVEQALGNSQSITLSYVGAHAGRLLQQDLIDFSNTPTGANANGWPNFFYVNSGGRSDYDSGQAQYQRRLRQGFTALASYTWSHCTDYGSQNYLFGYQKGNCDYDVRHSVSGAFSYDLPNVGHNSWLRALAHHWGVDNRFTARSGFPITLDGHPYIDPRTGKTLHAGLNWDPSQPLYVYGSTCSQVFQATLSPGQGCPGGRAINPAAFSPAVDASGNPVLGNAPRNFVRGFGAWQMDIGVRREFPLYERLKLQFRAEAFNVFNHPNFGAVHPSYCSPDPASQNFSGGCLFGQAFSTLANSLGILSPLYQMGGARSMQFALKLVF
jgi:Carboxypeptidase regulatory-like domain